MHLKSILAAMPYTPELEEMFRSALPGASVRFASPQELTDGELAALDAVIGNPDAKTLAKLTGLRLLQLVSSGVAAHYLTLRDAHPRAVLCSATGAYGEVIAEHMLAMLLTLRKNLHLYRDAQPQGLWASQGDARPLRGMRALLVGAGDIGTHFARLCKPLGIYVIGVRRSEGPFDPAYNEMRKADELDALLPQADAVALSVPHTPDTAGLMDARRFSLMKQGAYLLNVGRGSAVNQDALLCALRDGRLAGAALDVTVPEPLPPDHPLWKEKNALITPHVSAHGIQREALRGVADIACRNLAAFPDGSYASRVDYDTGYASRSS